jgi:hypothetical protein
MAAERNPAQKGTVNISANNFILLTILILVLLFVLLNVGPLMVT